jgi:F420H(2)-dependent quinone reductase
MPLDGEYEPSPFQWVREQVAEYEASRGERANTLRDTGLPIVIFTTRGNRSSKLRKVPVMRVEHNGEYALVASMGGAPKNPVWYYNLLAHPEDVALQDGPEPFDAAVRQVSGAERELWWERAVTAYPSYADYQVRTAREIPVLVASRREAAPPRDVAEAGWCGVLPREFLQWWAPNVSEPLERVPMNDRSVLQHIEHLVAQERELEESHEGTAASPEQRDQLNKIEVELDQCWDLLRQRRARRAAGLDPNEASTRSEQVVEQYLQ